TNIRVAGDPYHIEADSSGKCGRGTTSPVGPLPPQAPHSPMQSMNPTQSFFQPPQPQCQPGYIMMNGTCTTPQCPIGTSFTNSSCTQQQQCQQGYVQMSGTCVPQMGAQTSSPFDYMSTTSTSTTNINTNSSDFTNNDQSSSTVSVADLINNIANPPDD